MITEDTETPESKTPREPAEAVRGQGGQTLSASQVEDADFAVLLLMALTSMAARSKRRQADLLAALRGAGLVAEPRRVRAALRILQAQGAIENLVPLSDGGLLLTVPQNSGDGFDGISQWLPRDGSDDADP